MSGSSSTTVLAMTNCLVAGNRTYDSSSVYSGSSKGVGAYISGLKRVYMTDSVFASNGCQRMTAPWRGSFDGGCMYVYNAPIMAVNSRFIGNCTCVHSSGAAISLLGTGGHIFSNGQFRHCIRRNCILIQIHLIGFRLDFRRKIFNCKPLFFHKTENSLKKYLWLPILNYNPYHHKTGRLIDCLFEALNDRQVLFFAIVYQPGGKKFCTFHICMCSVNTFCFGMVS